MTADAAGQANENTVTSAHIDSVLQTGTIVGDVHVSGGSRAIPTPRQLPSTPRWFAGRAAEFAALTRALDPEPGREGPVVISAIRGTGGIGKTWLALQWARQHIGDFPDGQLFVDLHGFSPAGQPLPAETAVRGFLEALGVAPQAVPVDINARVGLYRSLIADRRILIILDNARTAEQVMPLLPGSRTCAVIVTSRHRLEGLITAAGARSLPLDVLTELESRALLSSRLGADRLAAEPDAVAQLLTCCAGFPLALSIVAGRAEAHPDFPLAILADDLQDTPSRLGVLDDNDPASSLPAALSWSYAALTPTQATTFRLLGSAPGPDISVSAAGALTNLTGSELMATLWGLERGSLVEFPAPGRCVMHDLVRLYAADLAMQDSPASEREPALRRVTEFYLHTAHLGDRLLDPHREQIELSPPAAGGHLRLRHETAAVSWFNSEDLCLLAAQQLAADHHWHDIAWQLAWVQQTYRQRRGHQQALLTIWEAGLTAVNQLTDPAARALVHRYLGHAYTIAERYDDALVHLPDSLTWAEQTDDVAGQIHSHRALAWAWNNVGDLQRSLTHATRSLRLAQAFGNPVWEARALNSVGFCHARLGDYERARESCTAALGLFRRHGDTDGEAVTLDSLGYAAHHAGEYAVAIDHYRRAIDVFRAADNTFNEVNSMAGLGASYAALGEIEQACVAWNRALDLYRAQSSQAGIDWIERLLADLDRP